MISRTRASVCLAVFAVAFVGTASARGLACSAGAMSPMEARIERAAGNKNATSTRILNAKKAARKIKTSIPDAQEAQRLKVKYQKTTISTCSGGCSRTSPATQSSGTSRTASSPKVRK